MAYLGNVPARSFISFERQVFTIVNSQTAYTLSHSVTNENDIRLVVNNIVQEPGSGKAYTASGTTLTLSAALVNGTDEMYCVFLGRAVGTVNAPAGSVGTSQLASEAVTDAKVASSIITGQTAETSIATDDLILLSDTSASGALKKMTRANFVSGVGGTNTPRVSVDKTGSSQTISATTYTKVTLNTERVDSDNAFASNDFTVPSGEGGDYYMSAFAMVTGLNGTSDYAVLRLANSGNSTTYNGSSVAGNSGYGWRTISISCIRTLSAGDTVSLYVYSSEGIAVNEDNANLSVIKLI